MEAGIFGGLWTYERAHYEFQQLEEMQVFDAAELAFIRPYVDNIPREGDQETSQNLSSQLNTSSQLDNSRQMDTTSQMDLTNIGIVLAVEVFIDCP